MLLLTTIVVLYTLLLLGFGYFCSRLFWRKKLSLDFFATFWLGFCVLIAVLQVWHFFLPINDWLFAIISFLAFVGVFMRVKEGLPGFKRIYILYAAGMLVALVLLLNHTLFTEPSYDHGLYHLQTVKWFNQFALVPGLGNLQHRLAFNSSQYLYAAFLNSSIFAGYSYYVANVMLLTMLLLQSLCALWIWVAKRSTTSVVISRVLLIPVIIWQAGAQPLAGYSADLTVFILQVLVFTVLLELYQTEIESKRRQTLFIQLLFLAATGITIKLSFAVYGVLSVMLAIWAGYRQPSRTLKLGWRIIVQLALTLFWILPWLVRNLYLSGYLLYPSRLIRVNLPWTMPPYLVDGLQAGISLWARTYSAQIVYTADLSWLLEWFRRFVFEARLALMMGMLLMIALIILSFKNKFSRKAMLKYGSLLLILSASLMYWFLSAPTYRFSGAIIWLWLFTIFLALLAWIQSNFSEESAWRVALLGLILLLFWLPNDLSRNISPSRFLLVPPENILLAQQQQMAAAETIETESGLQINVPRIGESCWDLPLPCTTPNDFMKNLKLIDPLDMGKGYMVGDSE